MPKHQKPKNIMSVKKQSPPVTNSTRKRGFFEPLQWFCGNTGGVEQVFRKTSKNRCVILLIKLTILTTTSTEPSHQVQQFWWFSDVENFSSNYSFSTLVCEFYFSWILWVLIGRLFSACVLGWYPSLGTMISVQSGCQEWLQWTVPLPTAWLNREAGVTPLLWPLQHGKMVMIWS